MLCGNMEEILKSYSTDSLYSLTGWIVISKFYCLFCLILFFMIVCLFRKLRHDKKRNGKGGQGWKVSSEDAHLDPPASCIYRDGRRFRCSVVIRRVTLENLHEKRPCASRILGTRYRTTRSVVGPYTWMHVFATSPLLWTYTSCESMYFRMEHSHIHWLLFLSNSNDDKTKVRVSY